MMKPLLFLTLLCLFVQTLSAQTGTTVHYGEADGLSHRHVTQILQDDDGFIWLSTWNGLNRFDGREFVTFKSRPGDGVTMPSDRFRNIAIDDHDHSIINCRVDDEWFRFSLKTGRFSPVSDADAARLTAKPGHGRARFIHGNGAKRFVMRDHQGLTWEVLDDGFNLIVPPFSHFTVYQSQEPADVKSICGTSHYVWVAFKSTNTIRLYKAHQAVKPMKSAFLAPDGHISASPTAFSSPVYSIYEGHYPFPGMWLGSKPDGLYWLQPLSDGSGYRVTHIKKGYKGMPSAAVYDIGQDSYGRLWLATMDAGVVYYDGKRFRQIRFGKESKARRLKFCGKNILAVATTEGLLIIDISPRHKLTWHLHRREANRKESLSNNACMDIAEIAGHYFVATESGGINEITSSDLLSPRLSFRHYDELSGLGSDVILSLTPIRHHPHNGSERTDLLAVSSTSLILLNPRNGESRELSQGFFGTQLSFSDARPVYDGRFFFGLNDGLAMTTEEAFDDNGSNFPIVLTSVKVENEPARYIVNSLNDIHLNKSERNVTITFAVLDYRNAKAIRYAYRFKDDSEWHYLGNSNDVSLSQLSPGDYTLELRATNAMGSWNPQTRTVKITVEPKFTETAWFTILIIVFFAGLIVIALWTRRYILRLKAKQKETLDAYLTLINASRKDAEPAPEKTIAKAPELSAEDSAFMSRIMTFVEGHISDSDVSVDEMARAAAVSVSGLSRKLKGIVGVTPATFLREARIRRACQLLRESTASVADIAYDCGFTDPKYFSRTFKQITGSSPSEYRENAL